MDKRIYNEAGKAGLIMGLIYVLISAMIYAFDFTLFASFWMIVINLLMVIGLTTYFYVNWRRSRGGYASFKDAFVFGFLTLIMSGIINLSFSCLLFGVIDPDLADNLAPPLIENTVSVLEMFGASDKDIDDAIEQVEKDLDSFSIVGQLEQFPKTTLVYAGFVLIMAAIFNRERPPFDDPIDSDHAA